MVDRREFEILKALVLLTEAKNVLEIGVYKGDASVHLAQATMKNNGKFVGMDLWDRHGQKNQFPQIGSKEIVNAKLRKAGLGYGNFELIQVDTLNNREHFANEIKRVFPDGVDFAFIDADHSYRGIANDFFVVYPLLKEAGVVVFHDTLRIDGCREFVHDLRTKYNDGTFDVMDFPYGQGDRHCGVTVITKRSFPTTNLGIDEVCGSVSTPKEIEAKEEAWYKEETANKPVMPTEFSGNMLLEKVGFHNGRKKGAIV